MLAIVLTVSIRHEEAELISLSELELNSINNMNPGNCILYFYILTVFCNFAVLIFKRVA